MKNIIIVLLLFSIFALTGCNKQTSVVHNSDEIKTTPKESGTNSQTSNNHPVSSAEKIADKLEVYYFHRTARCYSCKTIGQYVREIMEQKYGGQIKNGLIDFKELNIELQENKDIAEKYKASGSSLYINRIIDGQDNIELDANVWRLLGDEKQFKDYLENKINSYLGI